MVVRGSGRMKLDDEIIELKAWDAVRVPPGTCEATRPGPRASLLSSARPTSVTPRATTSRARATGGLTSPRGRGHSARIRSRTAAGWERNGWWPALISTTLPARAANSRCNLAGVPRSSAQTRYVEGTCCQAADCTGCPRTARLWRAILLHRRSLDLQVAVLQERLSQGVRSDGEGATLRVDIEKRGGLLPAERREALPDLG